MSNLILILLITQIQNDSILRNWQAEHMLASYEMMQTVPLAILSEKPVRPPLNGLKITSEFLAGYTGGVLGCMAGYYLFGGKDLLAAENGESGGSYGGLVLGSLFGGAFGYIFGNAYGVKWIGSMGNETGSWNATLWGSALGSLPAVLVLGITEKNNAPPNIFGKAVAALFGPVGATIGFNMTRKYKEPPAGSMIDSKEKLSIELVRINF